MAPPPPLLLLGCGYTLGRLAGCKAAGRSVVASTRVAERARALSALGVEVVPDVLAVAQRAAAAHVVYSVPPEAGLDAGVAAALAANPPARFVYLSSTGVYGGARGEVSEDTPVDPGGHAAGRLAAEALLRPLGAVCLRVAGIYGPGRGLHERLRSGGYRLPGDGSGRVSRVHVDDLAAAIEVALERATRGEVLNVADDGPAPQREVVAWLCARMRLPMPPSVPLAEAPVTLRGDRAISNARLKALGWSPRYPTFREGFAALV